MNRLKDFKIQLLVILPTFLRAVTVYAEEKALFSSFDDVLNRFCVLLNWMFTVAAIMTVFFVLIAGYKIMFSGGGKGVDEGKKTLMYAAIGFAVTILAKSVPPLVGSFLGSNGDFTACK